MSIPRRLRSLAGLVVAAAVLFAPYALAQGPDPVLVEVGGRQERASVVLERFDIAVRALVGSQGGAFTPDLLEQVYPFLPQFLDQRGTELALLQAARARGLQVDTDALDGFVAQLRTMYPEDEAFAAVLADAGFSGLDQLLTVVGEEDLIQRLFAALEDGDVLGDREVRGADQAVRPQLVQPEQVCARHILVASEAEAGALARVARAGASFAEMAATASTDRGSATRGGDLGCFGRGQMVREFEDAAFAAETGVATDPVRSAFGYHVILVEQRVPERTATLEEVRVPLEQQMRAERVQLTIEAIVANAGIRTFPDRIPSFAEAFGPRD